MSRTAVATIEKFSHDGRGIARINGKTTFIEGALPEETVLFQYTRVKKDFDEGRVLSIESSSQDRVDPKCPHFTNCGGCTLQHLNAKTQIAVKEANLLDLLWRVAHLRPQRILEPLQSNSWHYRSKARLSVRHVLKKGGTLVGFREKMNPRYLADISQCPVLCAPLDANILRLRALMDSFENPRIIAQIEVAAGDNDIALIFRNLAPLTVGDREKLRLFGQESGFSLFLQPGGSETVALFYSENEEAFLRYDLPEENLQFLFHPTDFTQVNLGLNQKMVALALKELALTQEDSVLDLFCGLGNFSLPIAKYAKAVIGIEGSEMMVARAGMNAKRNQLTNTAFYCANLEHPQALAEFALPKINKILLDPPRAGALEIVKQMDALQPEKIVYISCNPATLARDTEILVQKHGYTLEAAGVMDMFPQTAHVESIAVFG